MPINPITLQRRHAELGRIRLGNQVPVGDSGRTRPNKLDKFRFTSASEQFIRQLAELYGGTPQQWDNGGKPEWEVFTTVQSLQVIVVKGGLSQWMETWSGGGCIHRCDGVEQLDGTVCETDPNLPMVKVKEKVGDRWVERQVTAHEAAKPTTRLSMMLPDLEAIGVWRMESHGWNAAAEIPAVAELAQFVGDLVPARLHLMERRSIVDGQTSRFVVPVLDLQIGSQRLKEIVAEKSGTAALPSGERPAIGGEERAALPAGSAAGAPDYLAQAQDASAFQTVVAIRAKAEQAGHLTPELDAQLGLVAESLRNAAPTANPDGTYDAEVLDDQEAADAVWQRVLAVAGKQGLTLDQTTEEYARFSGGEHAATATATELERFLNYLAAGEQVSA